jgi:SAM-dependent methyltransferase
VATLNLGCGHCAEPGAVNVDLFDLPGVDVVHDLDVHPWPFGDTEFDRVRAVQLFEHVADPVGFMSEAHRVLVPGGELIIVVPHWQSANSYTDPTHRRHCTERTWDYWCVGEALHRQFYPLYGTARFTKRSVARVGDDLYAYLRRPP